ncbi:recombinase family protein [Arthrobacter sp. STN4]|uniref:recombinase family protein n=1 Tax=Arthrobacter sp. STN4 TaxID=2923276 RepID=UPI00211A6AB6|nr:recombinase family protein [Arthrobacter sp. STN4]MCQ9163005.1 recombinase family protein [Arthrobacter sp. STN4]
MTTTTTPAPRRAAIYTRISKDLLQEGLGVARQLEDCRKYAADHGIEIVAELEDNDISASGLKTRPSYLELRELMEGRKIDLALVFSTDRLHRSMAELVAFIELSRSTDVGIVSVTGGALNLATADGRFQAHIFGAVAAAEREKAQERILRKHRELAEHGKWPGRRVFGMTADATVIPAEAEIIRELAERVLAGEGFNDIARDLNARGVGTVTSATWRASTIVAIVRSARIAGHREHHGVVTARDAWPAIIDDGTSMLLRARLAPGQSGVKRGGPRKHLLTGLLKCGKCGYPLVRGLGGKSRTPNYRCAKNVGAPNCGGLTINAAPAEEFLAEVLFQARDRPAELETNDAGELAKWAAEREKLEKRKDALAEMAGSGEMDMAEWSIAAKAVKKKLADLPEPDVRPRRARQTGAELRAAWPAMPTPERRKLLEDTFIEVKILPRLITTGAKVFDPRRFEISWRR